MSARSMVDAARAAHGAGLHKSVVNRLLEPFMWHKIIVSATEWENFFSQRVSPLAQPEIRVVAEKMMTALYKSEPD
jgi:thymidylate synthase ThyX